jgi:predicted ABC-class ATPase
VSTILVIGGNGAYLDVADCVISMDNYQPYDVTEQARTVAAAHPNTRPTAQPLSLRQTRRIPQPGGLEPRRGKHRHSARAHGLDSLTLGREKIDLRYVAQLVDGGQTLALARALLYAHTQYINGQRTLVDILDSIMADIAERGLDCLDQRRTGDLVLFRRHELAAAINRLRPLCIDT